jgi:3-hydroxyisobutyrate dehydrogenase-like beta-hydroxyacid dehydrogenase
MSNELRDGVAILGIGTMGAAYATRLSSLGVPLTLFNRTKAKAAQVAAAKPGVSVAESIEDCAKAHDLLLVACSPTVDTIRALIDPLVEKSLLKGKQVVFIVDAGIKAAKYMEEVVGSRAASVVNVAMFGSCYDVMKGSGAILNASGRIGAKEHVQALLEQFGKVTFHEGGPRIAAAFAMAGHIGYLPLLYAQMHYQAMMTKAGIDPAASLEYFKQTNQILLEGYSPLLSSVYAKRDYSMFLFSHQLAGQILDEVVDSCKELGVDSELATVMRSYATRATTRGSASQCHLAAYEVIDPK